MISMCCLLLSDRTLWESVWPSSKQRLWSVKLHQNNFSFTSVNLVWFIRSTELDWHEFKQTNQTPKCESCPKSDAHPYSLTNQRQPINVGGATCAVAEDSNGTWRLGKAPMETNKTEGIGTKTNINNLKYKLTSHRDR